jgi:hypothetical protein
VEVETVEPYRVPYDPEEIGVGAVVTTSMRVVTTSEGKLLPPPPPPPRPGRAEGRRGSDEELEAEYVVAYKTAGSKADVVILEAKLREVAAEKPLPLKR